jgi:N-acetylneuraminic acid mutarotase
MFDALLTKLETDLRTAFDGALTGLVATARTQLDNVIAEVTRERAKGLAEVAREKTDLHREITSMYKHKEAHEGRVILNVGGYRYETSVQTLRRLPHTFFDAYFSGRYAQDVCADGSIFIDRDGEHFGQVLQYLRDGVVSVAEQAASELDVSVVRWLKREFGFYCIELIADQKEVTFAAGGYDANNTIIASMERYDVANDAWREMASMGTARTNFALCGLDGELYAMGGIDAGENFLMSVERYNPSLDSWSATTPMPRACAAHCAVAVGGVIYVMGGVKKVDGGHNGVMSVLKFDSRTQVWSEVTRIPQTRAYAGACAVGSDIYFLGGNGADKSFPTTTFRYDTKTDAWSTLAPMPEAKSLHAICAFRGMIYVLGGWAADLKAASSVHCFDPVANLWSVVTPMSTSRTKFASFVLGDRMYVMGGKNIDQPLSLASLERYDPVSDTWTQLCAMTQTRYMFSAHTMQVEVNLFDSLVLKAKSAQSTLKVSCS